MSIIINLLRAYELTYFVYKINEGSILILTETFIRLQMNEMKR
jgi:hypothetical protein